MKRPWVFNDHLPLIPDAGLKIVFFCTLSRHKHHFVHNFQDLTTVLLYIIFKILPSPQSFCTNISKFCHKHMYTVQCALCMSYLAQDGTMKKKEHQNIYFNQTQGSIFHFNMMSLVPTSIWNFITWNIYWEKIRIILVGAGQNHIETRTVAPGPLCLMKPKYCKHLPPTLNTKQAISAEI